MVPALAKHVRRCAGCGTHIATVRWASQYGVKVHAGRGLCQTCWRKDAAPLGMPPEPDLPSRRDTAWREWAKCHDMDTEMFFPVATDMNAPQWRAAKAVCRNCPVSTECLEDALATNALHGVRGGLDRNELEALYRGRNVKRRTA
jgi:WhiB family redox-sensing transcriptional regulator